MSPAVVETTRLAALAEAASALEAAGIETPRQDAEWLLAAVLGVDRFGMYLDAGRALEPSQVERLPLAGPAAGRSRAAPAPPRITSRSTACGSR